MAGHSVGNHRAAAQAPPRLTDDGSMLSLPFLALILLAAAEIYVIIVIAHLIGVAWTVAALIASTLAGLWLVRNQGRRAWQALREVVQSGVLPDRELGDAALIFAGGALIAFPGFVTDALGLVTVAPLTRPLVRRMLGAIILRMGRAAGPRMGRSGRDEADEKSLGKTIQGEVLRESDTSPGE